MVLKRVLIFFMSGILIFTTGCWDKVEIDERAFVLAIAVDTPGKDKISNDSSQLEYGLGKSIGDENKIKAVFYIPIPSKLAGGSVDAFSVEESEGDNMTAAIENLNMKFNREMFFGQTKILLIGENCIKNPVILKKLMDFIEREPDMGREASIAIVKGSISQLANVKPKFENVFASYMNGIFQNSGKMFRNLHLSINDFFSVIRENKGNAVVPVVEVEGDKVRVQELALIKDFKFLKYVEAKYLRPFSIIRNELVDGEIIIPYRKDAVSIKIASSKTSIDLKPEGDNLKYKVSVRIEGDIDNFILNEDIFDDKSVKEITDLTKKEIGKELDKTINLFQNEVGIDYLKLGDYTKKHNYNSYKRFEKDWDKEFKKVKIDYDVHIFIRRFGGSKK